MSLEIKRRFANILANQRPEENIPNDDIDFGPGPGDTEIKKPEVDAPGLRVNQNCSNNSEKECLLNASASISISEFLCNNKNKGVENV